MSELHLHHLEDSRSFRILWLLEELGLDYQLTSYKRTKQYLAPKSLQQVHSYGKSPILEVTGLDPNKPEQTLCLIESGHIIEYLMAKYDPNFKFHPRLDADSKAWRDYNFWLHYAEGSAMPPLVMRLVFRKVVERSPRVIRPIAKGIRKQVEAVIIIKSINQTLSLIEDKLSYDHWFAGKEFSAADVQMGFFIEAVNAKKSLDPVRYINTLNWLKRCKSRPAYQNAVNKGGKLDF